MQSIDELSKDLRSIVSVHGWLLVQIFSCYISLHVQAYFLQIYKKPLIVIQYVPKHILLISEMYQKYRKVALYNHLNLKSLFVLQRHTKTLNYTYLEADMKIHIITWLFQSIPFSHCKYFLLVSKNKLIWISTWHKFTNKHHNIHNSQSLTQQFYNNRTSVFTSKEIPFNSQDIKMACYLFYQPFLASFYFHFFPSTLFNTNVKFVFISQFFLLFFFFFLSIFFVILYF